MKTASEKVTLTLSKKEAWIVLTALRLFPYKILGKHFMTHSLIGKAYALLTKQEHKITNGKYPFTNIARELYFKKHF